MRTRPSSIPRALTPYSAYQTPQRRHPCHEKSPACLADLLALIAALYQPSKLIATSKATIFRQSLPVVISSSSQMSFVFAAVEARADFPCFTAAADLFLRPRLRGFRRQRTSSRRALRATPSAYVEEETWWTAATQQGAPWGLNLIAQRANRLQHLHLRQQRPGKKVCIDSAIRTRTKSLRDAPRRRLISRRRSQRQDCFGHGRRFPPARGRLMACEVARFIAVRLSVYHQSSAAKIIQRGLGAANHQKRGAVISAQRSKLSCPAVALRLARRA